MSNANININTRAARSAVNSLPPATNRVAQARNSVSTQRHSINFRVLDRNNLRTRLRNVELDMQALENDMRQLHSVTMQNIALYEQTDLETLASVQNAPLNLR